MCGESCLLFYAQPRSNHWSELVTRPHLTARWLENVGEPMNIQRARHSFVTELFQIQPNLPGAKLCETWE